MEASDSNTTPFIPFPLVPLVPLIPLIAILALEEMLRKHVGVEFQSTILIFECKYLPACLLQYLDNYC